VFRNLVRRHRVTNAMSLGPRARNGWRWFGIVTMSLIALAIIVATVRDFMRMPVNWVLGFGVVAAIVGFLCVIIRGLYEDIE